MENLGKGLHVFNNYKGTPPRIENPPPVPKDILSIFDTYIQMHIKIRQVTGREGGSVKYLVELLWDVC